MKSSSATSDDLGAAFARLQHGLRSYLRRRTPDFTPVDDLLQDIFVKALKSQRKGNPIENIAGWLYAAARTTVADYYRDSGVPWEALDDDMPGALEDDMWMHQELSTCLRHFAEQLSPLYRDTLVATDFRGETMRSLATVQGVSVSAIKSRAVRARAMLKEKLLSCCHVEVTGAFVSDYQPVALSSCSGKCS